MSVKITTEGTMSRQQSLQRGSALMVLGAVVFLAYAVVFLFLAFSSSGFEIGVATLNGVTTQQLNGINPAITGYTTHLHLATAGFIAATAIAAGGLVRCPRRLVVGVDNGRDLAGLGIGRGITNALYGTLQL